MLCYWYASGSEAERRHASDREKRCFASPQSAIVVVLWSIEAGQAGRSASYLRERLFFTGVQWDPPFLQTSVSCEVALSPTDSSAEDSLSAEFGWVEGQWSAAEAAGIAAQTGAKRGDETASCKTTQASATEENHKKYLYEG